ncbi:MAG TPA: hypothetical protein VEH27_15855 [Methylomirabilota bacterium]|nr:hypothetical protein [Methylomirabilota bacterium]
MAAHDQQGVDYHAFADSGNFVLNNECGDSISVWWNNAGTWEPEDAATYARHPGEGAILIRFGDKLVPTPFR